VSDTVLLADSDADRSRRVAAACRERGLAAHRVSHGAAALEYALAEHPAAMVVQQALPLIDGPRLAEILQSNPRTASLGVLIVDDSAEDAESGPASRRVLPGASDPETIARFLSALIERRPRVAGPEAPDDTPSIEGSLAQLGLGELIELFHVNRKSGAIELRSGGGRGAERGEIHLEGGDVVQARAGEVAGEKAFFRLLRWRRGSFAFREGPVRGERGIERATRALLREAERQGKEWSRLGQALPPGHARVTLKVGRASLPNLLHPVTQEVLLVLELSDRVQDVVDRCSYPDYQVLRTLQTLARRGMVELHGEGESPERPRAGLFSPAVAARLRDWLDQGRSRDAAPVDAKVPVWASDAAALGALVERLGRLPGAARTAAGRAGVTPLLRVPLDFEVGVELLGVPTAAGFAPIWPLCAHGALAALFVHAGAVEGSVEALGPAIEAASRSPRARVFHLLLDEKQENGAAELCERLGLFDDRFVLRLPLEPPDAAEAALRELLGRLVP